MTMAYIYRNNADGSTAVMNGSVETPNVLWVPETEGLVIKIGMYDVVLDKDEAYRVRTAIPAGFYHVIDEEAKVVGNFETEAAARKAAINHARDAESRRADVWMFGQAYAARTDVSMFPGLKVTGIYVERTSGSVFISTD
jgi:hypothetical protein